MSERFDLLRKLRRFVKKRGISHGRWKPPEGMPDEMIDDSLLAIKVRRDECSILISEIDRMMTFRKPGRKKKSR